MADEQLFGKYRLVRRLAFGGMAEIFLARLIGDEGFQKSVVLKRILPQFSADPDFTRMFVDEAVLAAKLTHPNVAQVYDFGQVDGTYFITMEHVDGTDLRKLIRAAIDRNRVLTPVEVAAIGEGMAKGLSYVHSAENDDGRPLAVVHRDISPHNVMLTRAGDVKIMDFGIAKAAARATQTATGTIKGKLAYMAPEQALGEEVDKLSDQFAVGLVLWECVVGKRVFEGDSEPELMSRVAAGRVRKLKEFAPNIPDELDRIIMRALSVERGRRYPDLRDLEQDLAGFRYGLASAGAVRLSTLVDELAPREASRLAREAGTAVLGANDGGSPPPSTAVLSPQSMSTDPPVRDSDPWVDTAPATSSPSLSRESGWTRGAEVTDPTRMPSVEPPAAAEGVAREPSPRGKPHGRALLTAGVGAVAVIVAVAAFAVRSRGQAQATLVIESDPPGAALLVSADADAAVLPTGLVTPAPIRGHIIGDVVHWRVEMAGMTPQERTTALTADVQHEKVVLARLPITTAPETATPITTTAATTTSASAAEPDASATPEPIRSIKSAKADKLARKQATGYLSLRTRGPWVEVYLNKKKLGETPLTHIEVPAGLITLQLRGQNGLSRSATVDIPIGGTVEQTVDTN
jgi:serine/threonine-protein kinase